MSDAHEGHTSGWEPVPQGEGYDGDATAFVQLPPEFMLEGTPLEAPGHGYVPPMITPLTPLAAADPTGTGSWSVQPPVAAEETPTASWTMPVMPAADEELAGTPEVPGVPGVPGAPGAAYVGSGPDTLPGGAPAPWAVPGPEPVRDVMEPQPQPQPGFEQLPEQLPEPRQETVAEPLAEPLVPPIPEPLAEPVVPPISEPVAQPVVPPIPEPVPEQSAPPAPAAPAAPVMPPVPAPPAGLSTDSAEHPHTSYVLRVNGADRPVTDSWIGESLLYVLRERLGLAGAKDGCSQGECGACNVQVDGRLVASCLVPAATAAGSEVRTVEGLATDGEPSDVQRALAKCGVQCGFCIPGMAMTVHDLLEGNHAPTDLEARQALSGNLCRCSGYRGVLDAVREVVTGREADSEPHGDPNAQPAPVPPQISPPVPPPVPPAGAVGDEAARIPHQIPHPYDGGTA